MMHCPKYHEQIGFEPARHVKPILDSRTGFRHREWRKCWRLIKPGRKCGAKLLWGEVYIACLWVRSSDAKGMFARDKRIGPYTYVYLVENVREEGRTKQRIIANPGRKEVVVARGDLDRLARSVVRLAQRSMVLSLVEGEAPPNARCQRIGPALLVERLWNEVGCRAVLEELAAGRQFEFATERAVFLTVLHRLFVSGSDRAAEKRRAAHRIGGTEALQLHHLYRAMAWLGEPLADQAGASELTPRCRKDLVEEGLFARRRDLFAELSVVFMDTTSLSFEGRGGEELGRRGHSKAYRQDTH